MNSLILIISKSSNDSLKPLDIPFGLLTFFFGPFNHRLGDDNVGCYP